MVRCTYTIYPCSLNTANVPIGSIQRIWGHENRSTTEIYLHSIGNSELEAMKVLGLEIGEKSLTQKKRFIAISYKPLILLARPEGFEPPTYGFVVPFFNLHSFCFYIIFILKIQ